jgi:hypothetical protein
VSPEGNFLTAIVVLGMTIIISWEYLFRGRFAVVAFLRKIRVSKALEGHSVSITGYLLRFIYKSEAQRVYTTSWRWLRVSIFVFLGSLLTVVYAVGAFLFSMGAIIFKAMIIVVGLKIKVPFISQLDSIARALAGVLRISWIYAILLSPFVRIITFLAQFEISLEVINLTCTGSSAPLKLLGNLFIVGIVLTLIESDFAVFKRITYNGLVEKFREVILSEAYRKWTPDNFERLSAVQPLSRFRTVCRRYTAITHYFTFHFVWVVLSAFGLSLVNSVDLFQNTLQFLSSKVAISDFASNAYISHSWDDNCNVVKGFYHFDTGIAMAASVVAWLLLLPALYEVSTVLIPGLPRGVSPIIHLEASGPQSKSTSAPGGFNWAQWYRTVWKYTSIFALDLWWAESVYLWVQFVKRNTPYDTGHNAPSVLQVENLIVDPAMIHVATPDGKKASSNDQNDKDGGGGDDSSDDDGHGDGSGNDDAKNDNDDTNNDNDNDVHGSNSSSHDRKQGFTEANGGASDSLSVLRLNRNTLEVIEKMERPSRRLFRAVIFNNGTASKLRFYTCDRVVNETQVWEEFVSGLQSSVANIGVEGCYDIFHIHTTTGEVQFHRTYPLWSFDSPQSAGNIAVDLLRCDENSAVVFVKSGATMMDDGDVPTALAEKSLFMMTSPEDYFHGMVSSPMHGGQEGSSSPSKLQSSSRDSTLSDRNRSIRCSQASMRNKESFSVASSSLKHGKEHLNLMRDKVLGPEAKVLKEMSQAIAWSGGDARRLPFTSSYILLGSSASPSQSTSSSPFCNSQDRFGYQQWHTLDGSVNERHLNETKDITLTEDIELGPGKLLDLVFTTTHRSSESRKGGWELHRSPSHGNTPRLCFGKRSFVATILRPRSDAENVVWRSRSVLSLPSYLQLCSLEYNEIYASATEEDMLEEIAPIGHLCVMVAYSQRYVQRMFACMPQYFTIFVIALGFGHLITSVGRRAWYTVVWKYVRFIGLCFGYWTDDVVELFNIENLMKRYSLVWTHPVYKAMKSRDDDVDDKRSDKEFVDIHKMLPEVTLQIMYKEDCAAALSTIVSTRAAILQLVPGLSILSIFANLTAIAPLLVYSKHLENWLPDVVCHHAREVAYDIESDFVSAVNTVRVSELSKDDHCMPMPSDGNSNDHDIRFVEKHNERVRASMHACLSQPMLCVKEWVVTLRTPIVFLTHSRALTFFNELLSFILVIMILFADSAHHTMLVVLSLCLLMPSSIVRALECYVLVGKILAISDDDLANCALMFGFRSIKEQRSGDEMHADLEDTTEICTDPAPGTREMCDSDDHVLFENIYGETLDSVPEVELGVTMMNPLADSTRS